MNDTTQPSGIGRRHQLENLSIHDGSLFPTSIGANPQLSIYGLTAKLSSLLAGRLAGGEAPTGIHAQQHG